MNKRKAIRIKSAFSLVEMLMTLLVASLLLAALAPVMTKKTGDNIKITGLGETYRAPADMQCYSYSDASPTMDVSINDVYSASFIIASAGGGGAGATSSKKVAASPVQITGTDTADTTQEITITEYMTDVKATLSGAGGGGAGGAGYVSGCPSGTAEFSGNSTVKAFCMTKYNVGEKRNMVQSYSNWPSVPDLPSTVSVANKTYWTASDTNAAAYCGAGRAKAGYCCWYAKASASKPDETTSNASTCSVTGYNSCVRTVCQYYAAKLGCASFNFLPDNIPATEWELPYSAQVSYLKSIDPIILTNNIYLCNRNTDSYGYKCSSVGSRCYGTTDSGCFPYSVWSIELGDNWQFVDNTINGPAGSPVSGQVTRAFSARCTLDKTNLFKSYSGAGGSSGAYISDVDLTEYVKKAGVNGKIILTAGKQGKGGNKTSSNNAKASDGTAGNLSKIIVQKQNGEIVYGIRVKGGSGGIAATNITTTGAAAVNSNISTSRNCEHTTDGTNWNDTSCTKNILKGGNGETKWKEAAAKGAGAISPITSNTSGNGAGGNGGTSSYGYNDKSVNGNGENGKGGFIKLTYNNEYAAAPGGGGGGGTVAQIKDIQIGRQANCTLTMGKGGKGGSIDNDGIDGGTSSIKCDTDARTFIVPGGKGGKKGIAASSISGATAAPTAGKGGDYSNINNATTTAIKDYNGSKKVIKEGTKGTDGKYDQTKKESIGGRGGTGGTGTKGACGGLYTENDETKGVCKVSDTDPKRIEGKGFKYEETVTPNANEISTSFGISGAGGGGGGWTRTLGPGKGGDGMNGYVCVYWYNE